MIHGYPMFNPGFCNQFLLGDPRTIPCSKTQKGHRDCHLPTEGSALRRCESLADKQPSSFGLGSFGDFHHKNCEKTRGTSIMNYAWNIGEYPQSFHYNWTNGYQWDYHRGYSVGEWNINGIINGNLGEYPPVSWPAWLESSPAGSRTYQILLHLESGHQPSAVHVATSPSQHCYSVGL